MTTAEQSAADVAWDLDPLLEGRSVDELLDDAEGRAVTLSSERGRIGGYGAAEVAAFMSELATVQSLVGRAGSFASLRFAADTSEPEHGALLQKVEERSTAIGTQVLFFDLEWAAIDDERADTLLADPALSPWRHHLEGLRRYRVHLLSEPEERILAEKSVTGRSAWVRLFDEQTSAVEVDLDGEKTSRGRGPPRLFPPAGDVRRRAADAVTAALAP